MKTLICLTITLLVLILSGCATMISGTSETIHVSTSDINGAICRLTNSSNSWKVITPASVKVKRGEESLQISCMKGNWHGSSSISSSLNHWVFSNIIFVPILGAGILGFSIDSGGAMYKYDQTSVVVAMQH